MTALRFSPQVGDKSFLAVGCEDGSIELYESVNLIDGNERKSVSLVQQILRPLPSKVDGRRGVQADTALTPNGQEGIASLDWSSVLLKTFVYLAFLPNEYIPLDAE